MWREQKAHLQHGQHDLPAAEDDAACPEECLPPEQHLHNGMTHRRFTSMCGLSPLSAMHRIVPCTFLHTQMLQAPCLHAQTDTAEWFEPCAEQRRAWQHLRAFDSMLTDCHS